MATRFTRLSVVAGERQLDASLPASRPVAEYLAHLPALFNLEVTAPPTVWALSTPRYGPIAPDRTLDEVGVLDGDVLYLGPAVAAAESPVVDDVVGAVAAEVEERLRPWGGRHRDRVVSCLVGAVLVALALVLAGVPDRLVSAALLLIAGTAVVAFLGWARTAGGVGAVAWTGPLFAALALPRLIGAQRAWVEVAALVAAGLLGVAVTAVVRRVPAVVVGGLASGCLAAVTALLLASGVDGASVAAWMSPVLVLALGVLPPLALATSGLVGLVQRGEQEGRVPRLQVTGRVHATAARVEGMTAALGAAAAACVAVLVWSGRPGQAALGLLFGLILALRSRAFAAATQVGYLLAGAVVAAVTAALALPSWIGVAQPVASVVRAGGLLLVLAVVAVAGYVRLKELGAARLTRLLDLLDTLAVIALVPMVLLAQNVVGWLTDRL